MLEDYKPRMNPERVERLRKWQDNLFEALKEQQTSTVEFLGRTFVIPPKVHVINPISDLIGHSVLKQVKPTDRVLDMGTGCGVNAILAASKSKKVVAVDINQTAVSAASDNARRNGVDDCISVFVSDLFQGVQGTFDLIIFDPPFRWFKPRGVCEIGTTDENYRTLTKFFDQVSRYLSKDGRILLCFGSSGDIEYLYELIERANLTKKVYAHRALEKEGIVVDYYTFLLKRRIRRARGSATSLE